MRELRQPVWLTPEEVPPLPDGWRAMPTADACVQLKPGKLFDSKTVSPRGSVPVLNQSATDFLGYHDEEPGVEATPDKPVVTFANHTCAMRLMKQPFSTIQNIFPKVGKPGVTDTVYFYYASLGRVGLTDYKGHHPIFRQAHIPVPPLPVQRRIAGILSAYDELMENSQRRIRLLEAMARALYREWFVHFRFAGHEKQPRVASPLGDIPQGWQVAKLDTVKAEQPHAINGGPFGSKLVSKDYVPEGVPVIRGSNLSESGRFDATGFVFVSNEKAEELRANLARPGDIVVTQRGTLGQIGMIPSGIGYDRFVISQSQMKVTLDPKKVSREYVFFFLRSEEVNQRIKNLASSSGVPHINLAVLREFQILLPPFKLQAKFGEFALGTEAAIEALLRQIQNLRRTRDLLLPRLLSGQVALAPSISQETNL